jgi:CubicO group peptidase (beta-lactamase class C family)
VGVVELVEARGVPAQLCVVRDGTVVLDHAFGCEPSSLFWIFSASKPLVAVLVHQLVEQGALGLDEPVAARWPAFGRNGKTGITVRHVLQHRAGIPYARGPLGDALAMPDWSRSVRNVEDARPRWAPGAFPAYHYLTYGTVLGELVRRVTGEPVAERLHAAVLAPLGLRDVHLGLPDAQWRRRVPIRAAGPAGPPTALFLNRRATRQAVVPAGGVSTTARDLATFYQALTDGRVLRPATLAEAVRPSSDGETDRVLHVPIRWAQGFQLGGPFPSDPRAYRPMGRRSHRETFGHNGSNCCVAWADPTRRLVCAYLTSLVPSGLGRAQHVSDVSDAVLEAFG